MKRIRGVDLATILERLARFGGRPGFAVAPPGPSPDVDPGAATILKERSRRPAHLRGDARLIAGDLAGAIDDFGRVLRSDPRHRTARILRGWAHFKRKEYEAARRDLDARLRDAPDDALARFRRSIVRETTGDRDGSKRDFERAARRSWALRARSRWATKDFLGAFKDTEKGIALDPRNHLPWLTRGFLFLRTNRRKEAIEALRKALALFRGHGRECLEALIRKIEGKG